MLREQGVAGSIPVIPTSIYKRAASPGSLFSFASGPCLVLETHLTDNLKSQGM